MYLILNEKKRVDAILKENCLSYDWRKDLEFLSSYYSKSMNLEEVSETIKPLLLNNGIYNRFDKNNIRDAKTSIKRGYSMQLKELDCLEIDESILKFINNSCRERIPKKILFTMYVWTKILNSSIIKPRMNKQIFKKYSGVETASKEYKKAIDFLLTSGLIREDKDMKHLSGAGHECYVLNFDVFSLSSYISSNEGESYKDYINRIIDTRGNSKDTDKIPYIDINNFNTSIEKRGKEIIKATPIYLYPEEIKEVYKLKEIKGYTLIKPSGNLIKLKGPDDYNVELCNSKKYEDFLHNPGLYIDIYVYNDGEEERCEICNSLIPRIHQYKHVTEDGEIKYICGSCASKQEKREVREEKRKKREENKKNEKLNSESEALKEVITNKRLSKFVFCDWCDNEFKLIPKREDYNDVVNKKVPCLCQKCKNNAIKNRGNQSWYEFAQEEIALLKEEEEVRKEIASNKIPSSKIKAIMEELED